MKKIYTTLFAAAAIVAAAVSCGKAESEALPEGSGELKVNIGVAPLGPDTKAIKTSWSEGDVINIWFDVTPHEERPAAEGPDLRLVRNNAGKWESSALSETVKGSLKVKKTGVLYGFWEGSNSYNDGTKYMQGVGKYVNLNGIPSNTSGRYGILAASFSKVDYAYDSDKNELTADISGWTFGEADLQIVVTGITHEDGKYSLYSTDVKCLMGIKVGDSYGECSVVADSGGKGTLGHITGISNGDGVAFVGHIIDNNVKNYTFVLLDNVTNKKYSFTKENIAFDSDGGNKVVGVKIAFENFSEVSD